ncbi:LOW QUALITY PROTEIN: arf-GAP with dual PH domain-containing protein 1 [Pristis pectinata]|uniref:LOW QUALITY PROTEIN: arf-GAP with dual PH domain-containing protein 1 n=1 Tax=Pristis pectinata TaxID=685728 RepID=UPI00223CE9E1|nr:LOW QUALITY PROTEIN: arf-GAP with dual PH domain-containing protein 1 [Pristis pectinata]
MDDWGRNKTALLELVKEGANSECADCGAADPDWVSCTLGVFICLNCSGIHRDLSGISRVKSIRLDFWDDASVEEMRKGNQVVKKCYEAKVPPFYYKPRAADCKVLKEQWIRAKYDRKEFIEANSQWQETFPSGTGAGNRVGYLWKRGKDKGSFHQRSFQLLEKEGTMQYFSKEDGKGPKGVIRVSEMNAIFQPEKIGNPNGLQITYLENGRTRNIFVYHKNGKDIVDWFNAIRAARFRYLKMAFPTASDTDLIPKITWNYAKEGYMEKTGPTEKEPFKRRWFTLDTLDRKLLYFKDPLDAYAQGEVFVGHTEHGYNVTEGLPPGVKGNKWKLGLTIQTPDRRFLFTCENDQDLKEWIKAFKEVISKPMSPQDYTVEATLRRKQR